MGGQGQGEQELPSKGKQESSVLRRYPGLSGGKKMKKVLREENEGIRALTNDREFHKAQDLEEQWEIRFQWEIKKLRK